MKHSYLLIIGLAIGLTSTIIPFSDVFNETFEDMVYFRGILISGLLINIFGYINLRGLSQNIIISMGGGVTALIIMSTYNLFCDVCIDTYNYYLITFAIVGFTLSILTGLKIWSRLYKQVR